MTPDDHQAYLNYEADYICDESNHMNGNDSLTASEGPPPPPPPPPEEAERGQRRRRRQEEEQDEERFSSPRSRTTLIATSSSSSGSRPQTGRCRPLEEDIIRSATGAARRRKRRPTEQRRQQQQQQQRSDGPMAAATTNGENGLVDGPLGRSSSHGTISTTSTSYTTTNWRQRRPKRSVIEEAKIIDHLVAQGFTVGLARTLIRNTDLFPLRIWIVDNSGSMLNTDGHRVVQTPGGGKVHNVKCTRWEEITSSITWHAHVSALLRAPTVFRLLNDPGSNLGPQQFSVAEGSEKDLAQEVKTVKTIMRMTRPTGSTRITQHLREAHASILALAPELASNNSLVALVIATDGLPTDEEGDEAEDVAVEFLNTLRMFEGLPVWLVIRLSTDDESVVNFYNDIDDTLTSSGSSLNMDVLDDFFGEAKEVYSCNPWLNYGLPLHLCRESGINYHVFDAIDERLLQPSELRQFCALLFDKTDNQWDDHIPDPVMDWTGFVMVLRKIVDNEQKQWNPIKEKVLPWIDFKELDRIYGASHKTSSSCGCVTM